MQNRNRLISFMQTFGIILVVLGHSTYQLMQAGHTPAIYKLDIHFPHAAVLLHIGLPAQIQQRP